MSWLTKDQTITREQASCFASTQLRYDDGTFRHTNELVNAALLYLYRKSSLEAKEFNTASSIQRIGIETEGILVSIGRISDKIQFKETAELYVDLGSLGIKARLPIIDRHSPLAYSIAQYVH